MLSERVMQFIKPIWPYIVFIVVLAVGAVFVAWWAGGIG